MDRKTKEKIKEPSGEDMDPAQIILCLAFNGILENYKKVTMSELKSILNTWSRVNKKSYCESFLAFTYLTEDVFRDVQTLLKDLKIKQKEFKK